MFKPFAGMERAGLEPATPSLQILLHAGLEWSVAVGAEKPSRLPRVMSSTLVSVGRRDLRARCRGVRQQRARGARTRRLVSRRGL